MTTKKVLSPVQVAVGSFWGGPLAAIYFLKHNFQSKGMEREADKTFFIGLVLVLIFGAAAAFLPESAGGATFAVVYVVPAFYIAQNMQFKKEFIQESEEYSFFSNWKIFGIGFITLAAVLILFIVEALVVSIHQVFVPSEYFGRTLGLSNISQ